MDPRIARAIETRGTPSIYRIGPSDLVQGDHT
jgi:hypothetical protein